MPRPRRVQAWSVHTCDAPLRVSRLQHEWWHPGQSVRFVRRHNHVLIWVLAGSGRAVLGGEEHPLIAGTALLLSPSVPHQLTSDHPPLELVRLILAGDDIDGRMLRGLASTSSTWRPERRQAVDDLVRLLMQEVRDGDVGTGRFAAGILDLLLLQLRRDAVHRREPAGALLARKARALMEQDARKVPDLRATARRLGVSPEHLCRCLARHLGTGCRGLAGRQRRRQAEELLAQPGSSVAGVAQALGYADVSGFCKAFRRWTGTTARAWRRRFVDA